VQAEAKECPEPEPADNSRYESIIAEAAKVRAACMRMDNAKLKSLGDWAKMSTVLGGVSAVGGAASAIAGFVGASKAGEAIGKTEKTEANEKLAAYQSALIDSESAAAAGRLEAMADSSRSAIDATSNTACGNLSPGLYGSALGLVRRVRAGEIEKYADLTSEERSVMINMRNQLYSAQEGNPEYENAVLQDALKFGDHPCGHFLVDKYAGAEQAYDELIGSMGGLSGGKSAKDAAGAAKTAGIVAGIGGTVSAATSGVTAISGAVNWKNFESQIEAARNCKAAVESFDGKLEQFYNEIKKENEYENKD
jgi:hypothetical protein